MNVPVVLCAVMGAVNVGLLLYIIGMSSPHWIESRYHSRGHSGPYGENIQGRTHYGWYGLFEICDDDIYRSIPPADRPIYNSFRACQAMITLGLITAILSASMTVVGCVYILRFTPLPRTIIYVGLSAGAATVVFTIITIAVWTTKVYSQFTDTEDEDGSSSSAFLGYSFALVIAGAIMVMAGECGFWFGSRSMSDAGDNMIPVA